MSQRPNTEEGDESLKVFIFSMITLIVIIAILMAYIDYLNAFIGALTFLHIYPFASLVRSFPGSLDIPGIGEWLLLPAAITHDFLLDGGFAFMRDDQRSFILTAGGRAALVIYGPIMLLMLFKIDSFRVDQAYRRRHTLESMVHEQSKTWTTTRMFRSLNPLEKSEVEPKRIAATVAKKRASIKSVSGQHPQGYLSYIPETWNRALRPEEWLVSRGVTFDPARYETLLADDGLVDDDAFDFKENWEYVTCETLMEILSEQLRTPWKSPAELRPCLRAIFAVMVLFHDFRVEEGNRLLNDLGILAEYAVKRNAGMDDLIRKEKGVLSRIDGIIASKAGKTLARIGDRHCWVESALPAMLEKARADRGILASPSFIWLKREDRLMWYILNSVGVETVAVEAAGAIAHCKAETQLEKPIRRPAVYQAARGILEDYLDVVPERIQAKREAAIRTRSPGKQIDHFFVEDA